MNRKEIIEYLKLKKKMLRKKYGIVTIGLFGSFARDEGTKVSDIDIFYERDKNFKLKSGMEFFSLIDEIQNDLNVNRLDFVKLSSMNPIIKHFAKEDFIYV